MDEEESLKHLWGRLSEIGLLYSELDSIRERVLMKGGAQGRRDVPRNTGRIALVVEPTVEDVPPGDTPRDQNRG